MMHERIRVADPDFSDSRLMVLQFGKGDNGTRTVRPYELAEGDLFDSFQLNEMISEVYQLWIEILTEREEEARRKPTGTTPFGF